MATTELFHAAADDIAEIHGEGIFGGIFALANPENRGVGGTYKIVLDDDDILDLIGRVDFDIIEVTLRKYTSAETDDEVQALFEMLDRDNNCPEELIDLLDPPSESYGHDREVAASFETQRLRGLIAKAAGYKAVQCADEYGTSYLVLPGTKIEKVA